MSDVLEKTDDSQGHDPKYLDSFSNLKLCKETSDINALERKTIRYVDWRILPLFAVLYSCALIDRTNLASAYVSGMATDLNLTTGARYSILSSIFYIPSVLLLPLAGILIMKKIGPRYWATFVIFGWGAIELGMAFATAWGYLCFCRVILGVLEASFFPGLIYIISIWYTRYEVQKRISLFYLISVMIASLSPMFAYVCSLLHGKRGLHGWQWIFIIEGSITFFLAILAWFYIPQFPHKNTFLTSEQTKLVLKRVDDDRGDALPDPVTWQKIKLHLGDWTLWAYGFMYMFVYLPNIAMAYFTPIILKGMGFSQTKVLLLSCPPFIPAFFSVMFFSYLSDRYKHRSGFIVLQAMICTTGLILTAFTTGHAVRYFGVCLIAIGGSGTTPGIFVYSANNVVSHSKRTVQTALTVSLGGVGGIIGTTVFRQKDYPRYIPGLSATIGAQILLSILIGITTIHFRRLNRQMREGKREQPLEGQPGFYYTL